MDIWETGELFFIIFGGLAAFVAAILRLIPKWLDSKIEVNNVKIKNLEEQFTLQKKEAEQDLELRKQNIERVKRLEEEVKKYQNQVQDLLALAMQVPELIDENANLRLQYERKLHAQEIEAKRVDNDILNMRSEINRLSRALARSTEQYKNDILDMQNKLREATQYNEKLIEEIRKRDTELQKMSAYLAGVRDTLQIIKLNVENRDYIDEEFGKLHSQNVQTETETESKES